MKLPTIYVCNSARSGDVVGVVQTAVDLIAQGRINPRPMISHNVDFANVSTAYEMFSNRTDGCVKPIIRIS
jgi:threonine dehydrogenase-like Zn-dependent dehydrogenase